MSTRFFVSPALALLAWAVLIPSAAHAQMDTFHSRFDTVLTQQGVVGGGFAFVHGQSPAAQFSFGEARQESHQKVDAETAFNWASITKTFTAIAILQLRDRGLLSLDDSAVRYVPELRQVHDIYGPIEAITIRHLLTHSAGFRNPTWPWDCDDAANCDWQPFEPTWWAQVAAMLPYTHIAFKPGSRWSYSNLGYVFLGQIIERLSGDDFEVYIDKNILKPLGMTRSYFDRAPFFLESHVAASYLRSGTTLTPQPLNFDTGITTSNSGLKAPLPDMVKYLHFLIGDSANPIYEVVLKRSSLEEAWTGVLPVTEPGQAPTPYTAGPKGAQPKMGLGFFVAEPGGHRYIYHASILAVNTTNSGAQPPPATLHPQSNTEPDPNTDLRQTLRGVLIETVFPANAGKN